MRDVFGVMRVGIGVTGLALVASALLTGSADAALPKPKPWQWKPEKVEQRLEVVSHYPSVSPITSEAGGLILSVGCRGLGRGVAGRFSRFTCGTTYGGPNTNPSSATLIIRIRPVGTGKLCVVTTMGQEGKLVAVPYNPPGRTLIAPEWACP